MALSDGYRYNLTNDLGPKAAYQASLGDRVVKAAGVFTTAGGDATETISSLTGVTSSDVCVVLVKTQGATPRVVQAAACTTDAITVTLDDDPSTDHVLQYVVFSAVS